MKQMIITISREFGSGGREIGFALAEKLGIPCYSRNLLEEFADENDLDKEELIRIDEKPKHFYHSRRVRGFSSSNQEQIENIQFKLLKTKAVDEDSFVVIGRCADDVLKEFGETVTKIFITGDDVFKTQRIMQKLDVSTREAHRLMKFTDKSRKAYHDFYTTDKSKHWGQANTYDLTVNSATFGIEGTVDFIYSFLKTKYDI